MIMNYSNILYRIKTASLQAINDHLMSSSRSFIPPLDGYVNIEEYSQKIYEYAVTFEAWHKKRLVGLAAVYFNNQDTKIGFCTNLSVLEKYQGLGIGHRLINVAIKYGINHGFTKLDLEVKIVNEDAICFYEKIGFVKKGINKDCYILSLELDTGVYG